MCVYQRGQRQLEGAARICNEVQAAAAYDIAYGIQGAARTKPPMVPAPGTVRRAVLRRDVDVRSVLGIRQQQVIAVCIWRIWSYKAVCCIRARVSGAAPACGLRRCEGMARCLAIAKARGAAQSDPQWAAPAVARARRRHERVQFTTSALNSEMSTARVPPRSAMKIISSASDSLTPSVATRSEA